MVFQSYALYPHMTVGENMGFPLKLAGVDKGTIQKKVDEAAEMLELTQHLDRKPSNLSGGQRQRVAMGRAIVRQPEGVPDGRAAVQPRRQAARADAHPGVADPEEPGHHDALRHPRPDRGHDARRPGRGHARRRGAAGRVAVLPLRPPGQPVRRRLHRQPVDELPARARSRAAGSCRRPWARPSSATGAGRPWSGRRAAATSSWASARSTSRTRRWSATSRAGRSTHRSTSSRRWGRTSTPTSS